MSTRLSTLELDGWALDDAEQIARAHPDTFWLPAVEKRKALEKGALVKLLFRLEEATGSSVERMWVMVEGHEGPYYCGTLDNEPLNNERIQHGAKVLFEARHVIDIWED